MRGRLKRHGTAAPSKWGRKARPATVEHLWTLVREALANRGFDHVVGLAAKLCRRCDWLACHSGVAKGAAEFHWVVNL